MTPLLLTLCEISHWLAVTPNTHCGRADLYLQRNGHSLRQRLGLWEGEGVVPLGVAPRTIQGGCALPGEGTLRGSPVACGRGRQEVGEEERAKARRKAKRQRSKEREANATAAEEAKANRRQAEGREVIAYGVDELDIEEENLNLPPGGEKTDLA